MLYILPTNHVFVSSIKRGRYHTRSIFIGIPSIEGAAYSNHGIICTNIVLLKFYSLRGSGDNTGSLNIKYGD